MSRPARARSSSRYCQISRSPTPCQPAGGSMTVWRVDRRPDDDAASARSGTATAHAPVLIGPADRISRRTELPTPGRRPSRLLDTAERAGRRTHPRRTARARIAGRGTESDPERLVAGDPGDGRRRAPGVAGGHEQAVDAVVDQLGDAADAGGHHGDPGGHGLEHGVGQALVVRRLHAELHVRRAGRQRRGPGPRGAASDPAPRRRSRPRSGAAPRRRPAAGSPGVGRRAAGPRPG